MPPTLLLDIQTTSEAITTQQNRWPLYCSALQHSPGVHVHTPFRAGIVRSIMRVVYVYNLACTALFNVSRP